MKWINTLVEHRGVVLQHGGWARGWECNIENWHIRKCHGEPRVIWVVKWMGKYECLWIILINSVQGNKKLVESLQNMSRKPVSMFKKIWQWGYLDYKTWRDVPISSSFFFFLFLIFSLSLFFGGGGVKLNLLWCIMLELTYRLLSPTTNFISLVNTWQHISAILTILRHKIHHLETQSSYILVYFKLVRSHKLCKL